MQIYENQHYYVTGVVESQRVHFYAYRSEYAPHVSVSHYGYREPQTKGWWFWRDKQQSIPEAAMSAIKEVDTLAKQYNETLSQMQQAKVEVEAFAEIVKIVSEI